MMEEKIVFPENLKVFADKASEKGLDSRVKHEDHKDSDLQLNSNKKKKKLNVYYNNIL